MRFRRRLDAGLALAERLDLDLGGLAPCLVAGIPRGGIAVAAPIAEHLHAPLVAIHTRRLSPPHEPALAFGALDEDGHALIDHGAVVAFGLGSADVERIKAETGQELARRRRVYPAPSAELGGKTVVIVDEGLGNGLPVAVAIAYAQRHEAAATIVAIPCASLFAAQEIRSLLKRKNDRFVCLDVDPSFKTVADYYMDFGDVSDFEVARLLNDFGSPRATRLT